MLNFGGVVIWLNYKYIQYFTNLDFPEIFGPIYGLTSATLRSCFFFRELILTRVMIDGKFIGRGTPPRKLNMTGWKTQPF